MPIYLYECDKHGEKEVTHPMGDETPVTCECGTVMARRYALGGIIFNAAGFYKTGG